MHLPGTSHLNTKADKVMPGATNGSNWVLPIMNVLRGLFSGPQSVSRLLHNWQRVYGKFITGHTVNGYCGTIKIITRGGVIVDIRQDF